jgi:beta-phosphoglucomutase
MKTDFSVIFDIDGTMVNNTAVHRQAWFDLCAAHRIPMNLELYHQKIHARSNDRIVPALFGPEVDAAFIRQIEQEKESLYRKRFAPIMRPAAGLIKLLEALSAAGVPCGAASNSPWENVEFVLDGLDIAKHFKAVVCRDHVKVGKPDPEMLLKTAAGLGLKPGRCVLFEDSASGFKAARSAGMPVIAITFGADPYELNEAHDAAAVMEDFRPVTLDFLRDIVAGRRADKLGVMSSEF